MKPTKPTTLVPKIIHILYKHTYGLQVAITRYTGHEIRTDKCLDTCHHKMKLVLTFTKNDLTLVELMH